MAKLDWEYETDDRGWACLEAKVGPVTVRILQDEYAEDPRDCADYLWRFYGLGRPNPDLTERDHGGFPHYSEPDEVALKARELEREGAVVRGVQAVDYGSSGGRVYLCDLEDANHLAVLSAEKYAAEYGERTAANTRRALRVLEGEVAELNSWAEGDVSYFSVTAADGTDLETVGGFYGAEWAKEAAEEAARLCAQQESELIERNRKTLAAFRI